jgi:hypothetical protein
MMADLDRDDIFLLLEAYKNQVETNQTLMEQQSRLLAQHNQILDKQQIVCNNVNDVIVKITSLSERDAVKHSKLVEDFNTGKLMCVQDHGILKSRISVLYVGITAILIPLMGLLYIAYEKLDMIKTIAKKLGVEVG